jgi:nicotinamidase-related amidase
MRLPADAALLVLDAPDLAERSAVSGAITALLDAWRGEDLPVLRIAAATFDGEALEAGLEPFGATTIVVCGSARPEAILHAVRTAAERGYRLFVVAEACPEGLDLGDLAPAAARLANLSQTLQAAAMANSRRRWRAARGRGA